MGIGFLVFVKVFVFFLVYNGFLWILRDFKISFVVILEVNCGLLWIFMDVDVSC